jgi:beta-galactosidase
VPESEMFNYVQQGNTDQYAQSARGAYQAFFDSNIQADWVHIDHVSDYPIVYLPYPVMLTEVSARKLRAYVEGGGVLVSEGLPAYFEDHGRAGVKQPNFGLDEVFGAKEASVQFTPDLLDDLVLTIGGRRVHGRYFLQVYTPAGGTAAGTYENGRIAAVEHRHGKGSTLLIGSFPGAGYYRHRSAESKAFFASLLDGARVEQQVRSTDPDVKARVHTGPGGTYVWVVNPTRTPRDVTIALSDRLGRFRAAEDVWDGQPVSLNNGHIRVQVADRNAAVIRLK